MLKEQINADYIEAMKRKELLKKGVLSILKANMDLAEKEAKKPLTEDELIAIINRELKQTEQALAGAEEAARADLIDKEKEKIALLQSYLPQQMTLEEIMAALQSEVNSSMKMGEAMKLAKAKLGNHANNALISQAVKQLIQ